MILEIIGAIWLLSRVAMFALAVWALVSALRRSSSEFVLAAQGKTFWVVVLVLCVLVTLAGVSRGLYSTFPGLVTWIVLYGTIYYLGPEEQRMGPRGFGGRGGGGAGSWR